MDRQLRSYDITDAQAQFLLARSGFVSDQFEDHVDLGSGVVLISTMRVIFFNEEGTVRQVLELADVYFVEVVDDDMATPTSSKVVTVSLVFARVTRHNQHVHDTKD